MAEGTLVDDLCEKFETAAAAEMGVSRVSNRTTWVFEPPDDASYEVGTVHRAVDINVTVGEKDSNSPVTERLADDLQSLLSRTSEEKYEMGPLYSLPVGDTGYAVCDTQATAGGDSAGRVQAGYVVDGTTYVLITIMGRVLVASSDMVAPPEDALIADPVTVLTATGA